MRVYTEEGRRRLTRTRVGRGGVGWRSGAGRRGGGRAVEAAVRGGGDRKSVG